jgi:AraC-like DNA-binding protein
MASSTVLYFNDPLSYQSAISPADLEFVLTGGGQFRAEMTKVRMDQLWMDRFYRNMPSIIAGAMKPDRRVFTFFTSEAATLRHRGMEVSSGDIIVNNFDEMHQQTEAGFHLGSMSLTPRQLDATCKAIVGLEFTGSPLKQLVRPNAALMSRLLELHKIVAQIATTMPELLEVPEAARSLEQQLIHVLVRCLTEGVSLQMSGGGLRRYQIVSRFKEYLEAHPNKALYLPEMCAAVCASERTLRNACEEHLGMGPIRFLALRRMNLVHRALMQADDASSTVTAVATEHGFWELGRFSVAYRALFGEKPSVTLHRRPHDRVSSAKKCGIQFQRPPRVEDDGIPGKSNSLHRFRSTNVVGFERCSEPGDGDRPCAYDGDRTLWAVRELD